MQAGRALQAVNAATSTMREQLVQAAANLAATERLLDRLSQTVEELAALQAEVEDWGTQAGAALEMDHGTSDLGRRVQLFRSALGRYLIGLGHSAVAPENVEEVRLGENYMPYVGHRRLRSLGSASDRPRMVAALHVGARGSVNGGRGVSSWGRSAGRAVAAEPR